MLSQTFHVLLFKMYALSMEEAGCTSLCHPKAPNSVVVISVE